eukprot:TRINITY_DN22926_c0_g1_i1.p1 TRINITY_DN22926_c0_g1~~TRINITY_DN22926_c0_g1_i1.p1  ORF type:complete len:201 (+),score=38.11 TRINITY_DN22926_c0_g1_i1:280-882(+)
MHIVLAQLLVFLREVDAFWIFFHAVSTQVFPTIYISSAMPAIVGSSTLDVILVKAPLPVRHHILRLGEETKHALTELFALWFRHVYVGVFPTDTLARIWDCAFIIGPKVLVRVACLLVISAAHDILEATNATQVVAALSKVAMQWSDPQILVDRAYNHEVGSVPTSMLARLQMQYARNSCSRLASTNSFEPVHAKGPTVV